MAEPRSRSNICQEALTKFESKLTIELDIQKARMFELGKKFETSNMALSAMKLEQMENTVATSFDEFADVITQLSQDLNTRIRHIESVIHGV